MQKMTACIRMHYLGVKSPGTDIAGQRMCWAGERHQYAPVSKLPHGNLLTECWEPPLPGSAGAGITRVPKIHIQGCKLAVTV